jgi:hypothetical protein
MPGRGLEADVERRRLGVATCRVKPRRPTLRTAAAQLRRALRP